MPNIGCSRIETRQSRIPSAHLHTASWPPGDKIGTSRDRLEVEADQETRLIRRQDGISRDETALVEAKQFDSSCDKCSDSSCDKYSHSSHDKHSHSSHDKHSHSSYDKHSHSSHDKHSNSSFKEYERAVVGCVGWALRDQYARYGLWRDRD